MDLFSWSLPPMHHAAPMFCELKGMCQSPCFRWPVPEGMLQSVPALLFRCKRNNLRSHKVCDNVGHWTGLSSISVQYFNPMTNFPIAQVVHTCGCETPAGTYFYWQPISRGYPTKYYREICDYTTAQKHTFKIFFLKHFFSKSQSLTCYCVPYEMKIQVYTKDNKQRTVYMGQTS